MKECFIRNLCDGPRDYPLKNGESIYLGSKGRATGIIKVQVENISEALRNAEAKGLILIQEIKEENGDV